MPLYEYQCLPHGHRFEVRQGINDDPVTACQECGAPVRRVVQPVGIVFKGSGFYVNDSRKSSNPASKPTDGNKAADTGKADTSPGQESTNSSSEKAVASTETKKDAKSESKAAS